MAYDCPDEPSSCPIARELNYTVVDGTPVLITD